MTRSVFLNPAFIAQKGLLSSIGSFIKKLHLDGSGTWLDVGCGSRPYEHLFHVEKYLGMDIEVSGHPVESKRHDILYDGETFPISSDSIDGVICTQVLEHAAHPEKLVSEIYRVLKPKGKLILTAPFLWQEHEIPYDFTRFSSFGLIHLLESQGYCITEYRKTSGAIEALAQTLSTYVFTNFNLKLPGSGKLVILFLCAPIQIIGILLQKILPDKRDLFLNSAVLAYKPEKEA